VSQSPSATLAPLSCSSGKTAGPSNTFTNRRSCEPLKRGLKAISRGTKTGSEERLTKRAPVFPFRGASAREKPSQQYRLLEPKLLVAF
jgi:hypothetical protein